ncbi:phosphate propanoyltransferase [Clostridium septicum]|uniref:Phosphate propanoyltransferase n=1 Tax=Clostridium septicum TaxID=1504 RepID=A0A9N7PL90_CLOSE|nr:phosphate propanoyltransferase [Clostridium septicum]AYE35172.1 phosphate propanoyltransferase [Clostridium septicum]MDU1313130.1 phosphate propanoyltransferase [Clostridium septicum]QAS60575.1 phosphate propanoyltransferase [Clostridium septicum]UEC20176.1 phosphate propanoyltransferase [Clostridium septicum]USS01769.1 phosphate propanoyltransferase [Clostridium septicum]
MDNCEALLKLLLEAVKDKGINTEVIENSNEIPVGISNRHVHLSQRDLDKLFGEGYKLTKIKELSQPGQYACKETVTICGPKGAIEKVRILGPVRSKSQIEVLMGDCIKLGAAPHVRLSGELNKTSGITVIGPNGSVQLEEGLIVAQRHIHMTPEDAKKLGVCDGEIVSIKFDNLRGGTYSNVAIRANDTSKLECHLDIEEANAVGINSKSKITIVK